MGRFGGEMHRGPMEGVCLRHKEEIVGMLGIGELL